HYCFDIDFSIATGYSFMLIAVTASSGAVQNIRKNIVDYNAALYYGIPSVITVFIMRRFVMGAIPKVIGTMGAHTITKDYLILTVLSVVMFLVGYKMITSKADPWEDTQHKPDHLRLAIYAVCIGAFLGLIGAGGGFLMVPALIYFAKLPPQ